MFVTFNSQAYENISYFETVAKRLLSLMGHSGTVPGAFKAVEVAQALSDLQQGLAQQKEHHSHADDEDSDISLAKRAVPLISMLQAATRDECDVLWSYTHSPS
ncbi:MAG: DUF1840 domain-containing protein [Legionella sp.]